MGFSSLVFNADKIILDVMGQDILLTIHFPNGAPDVTVEAITVRPPIEEEVAAGKTTGIGTGVVYMWTRQDRCPNLILGCTATVNGVDYDVHLLDVDREQGATLKMRKRKLPWNVA
jgi:hypothetical protein